MRYGQRCGVVPNGRVSKNQVYSNELWRKLMLLDWKPTPASELPPDFWDDL